MNQVLNDEKQYYIKIWKKIIIQHSSDNYNNLNYEMQGQIDNVIMKLKIKNFSKNKSIAAQLDKSIVKHIINLCEITFDCQTLDNIFKRTRTAIFRYFHYKELINAYLKIGEEQKAINVLKYVSDKDHKGYWYAIYNYKSYQYKKFNQFYKKLIDFQRDCIAKLLLSGEKLDLKQFSLEDLQSISSIING